MLDTEYVGNDDRRSKNGRVWSVAWVIVWCYKMDDYHDMKDKGIILSKNDFISRWVWFKNKDQK